MTKIQHIYFDASSVSEPRVSGIGHMTAELIRALSNHPENGRQFDITLIVCRDKKQYLPQWNYENVRVISLPLRQRVMNLIWKLNLLPPMDLLIGRGVYVFPNYKNCRLLLSKSLTFVCDVSYLVVPEYVQPKNREFLIKNINRWIKRADKVIAISDDASRDIVSYLGVDPNKITLVPCGVDQAVFKPLAQAEVDEFIEMFDLPKEYILYLGNIEPRKNVRSLIDAYKLLPETLRSKHPLLLVGGGGWLNEQTLEAIREAQAEGYEVIHPDEYIADKYLPALHSGAALLVHPAYYEGFGIAPLQAMACGTPVVVADASSLPEVIGDAGLLVDPRSPQDISDKISMILSDKKVAETYSQLGVERARRFSWRASAETLIKLVQKESN